MGVEHPPRPSAALCEDLDSLALTRLQGMLGLTPGSLITCLRELNHAGYVRTEETGDDRAQAIVALTCDGRAALDHYAAVLRRLPRVNREDHQAPAPHVRAGDADWLHGLGAEAVVGDVYDRNGMLRVVGLSAPDVVMDQLTDLKGGNFRANSEMRRTGTRHLVDAALAAGVRRVVAQSIAWAYEPGEGPAAEDVPLDLGASESRRRTVQGVAALDAAGTGRLPTRPGGRGWLGCG